MARSDRSDWEDGDTAAFYPARAPRRRDVFAGASGAGVPRGSRYYDDADETGPVPVQWRHRGGGEHPENQPVTEDLPATWSGQVDDEGHHPSAPLPPPPPGAWSRLAGRDGDDAPTEAQPPLHPHDLHPDDLHDDDLHGHSDEPATDAHALDDLGWEDRTGGLEVIGANVDEDQPRRGRRRRRAERRVADVHDDLHDDDLHDDELHDGHPDDEHDEDIPLKPYDPRSGRRRRRRRPVAVVFALLVLAGLIAGVVFGGQKLIGLFVSEDYSGQGTGSVQVRVQNGDTLSDIGRTLVNADVIASVGPFTDAAKANPKAMGITAGVYKLRTHMSGAAALELLLEPSSRLVTRVTIPEGTIAVNTLQKISDATGMPLADLQAAAANPAALGLPAYANGSLEGFLFPATYDVEPDTTAAALLSAMVARTVQALDQLGVPEDQRLSVLTEASIVQAEAGSVEDMAKVARVLDNRLAINMPLQLDTTVNYANGKSGLTTTPEDRQNPSPYNTYVHPGLPPGPIGNPGEDAIKAVLTPAQGDWLFFVVVDPDTGETRFATTAEEHAANVALFQQWLREHPGG
nr:endolytic transglycosylase MltG [Petropleomorpha daqingensis]